MGSNGCFVTTRTRHADQQWITAGSLQRFFALHLRLPNTRRHITSQIICTRFSLLINIEWSRLRAHMAEALTVLFPAATSARHDCNGAERIPKGNVNKHMMRLQLARYIRRPHAHGMRLQALHSAAKRHMREMSGK